MAMAAHKIKAILDQEVAAARSLLAKYSAILDGDEQAQADMVEG